MRGTKEKVLILENSNGVNIWINTLNIQYFEREHHIDNSGVRKLYTRINLTNGSILVHETCEKIKQLIEN
mgnify:CR=1 FL=1